MRTNWAIQFMHTPTSIIFFIDSSVDPEDIAEYGAENTTGILQSHFEGTIERLDIPELWDMACDAAVISKRDNRDAYYAAWKRVESKADELCSLMNRQT